MNGWVISFLSDSEQIEPQNNRDEYDSFSWSDIISGLYARGVKNITICIENDEGMVNQYDYLTNVINANGNITQDYAALIDVALDEK